MIFLNLYNNIRETICFSFKAIYNYTINPIVNLACSILFAEKITQEKMTQKMTYPVNPKVDTSRVQKSATSTFLFKLDEGKQTTPIKNPDDQKGMNTPIAEIVNTKKIDLEGIETIKVVPKEPKTVKLYVTNSSIPYFLNRKGFPNPSNKNCGFNSLSVLYAHIGCSIPPIHPHNRHLYQTLNHPENFQEAIQEQINNLEQQKVEAISIKEISNEKRKQFQIEIDKLKQQLESEEKELASLNTTLISLQNEIGLLQSENAKRFDFLMPGLKKELHQTKKKLETCEEHHREKLAASLQKIQIKINDLELEKPRSKAMVEASQEQLKQHIQSKEKQIADKKNQIEENEYKINEDLSKEKDVFKDLELKITSMKEALNNQISLSRGVEILAILRGEIEGDLTMEDAQLLSRLIDTIEGQTIYKGSKDVAADSKRAKLKAALDHGDWRGLRVGGHGHWWTYIRNPDGQTIDEINDSHIYKKRMTIEQLFKKYSDPNEWQNTQITFYHGIKE